ncbi:MAG: hypothetical protein HN368_14850 [Spirochaetales bacterium]|nr:hypothetical protein [Spirochaetales bacterium]
MNTSTFESIDGHPESISAQSVICRMLDGLGFRFYWATLGLNEEDFEFSPAPERWNILETVNHIQGLMLWIHRSLFEKEDIPPGTGMEKVNQILELIGQLRTKFAAINDSELDTYRLRGRPFWNLINGPIEDAVYHTGQIDTLRRIAGNPPQDPDFFAGAPPR